jgi:hypothetical protein
MPGTSTLPPGTARAATPGAPAPPAARGPWLKRHWSTWPEWIGYAAAGWSLLYGLLGLFWALGGPGFPFGKGDVPGARDESILGGVHAATAAPVIAILGLAGAVLAVTITRTRPRGAARRVLLTLASLTAFTLLAVIPDQRILTLAGYAPVLPLFLLSSALTGWPPLTLAKVLPWQQVNLLIIVAGGLLWAGAALAFQRRTADACEHCGRRDHRPGWTRPEAAARWGKLAAVAALVIPLGYSVTRWAWVVNIPLGMPPEGLRELHASGAVWAGAWLATFGAAGGVLTLGLYQRWSEVFPRWIPFLSGRPVPLWFALVPATAVTVALASAGVTVLRLTDWTDPGQWLTQPFAYWPLWAVALGVATLGYHLRRRGPCQFCHRT